MNREETNRFLTEAMGLCWHTWDEGLTEPEHIFHSQCLKCGVPFGKIDPSANIDEALSSITFATNLDFFTPEGFFVAWEWARSKEWWIKFHASYYYWDLVKLINPSRFALALAEFLEGRK